MKKNQILRKRETYTLYHISGKVQASCQVEKVNVTDLREKVEICKELGEVHSGFRLSSLQATEKRKGYGTTLLQTITSQVKGLNKFYKSFLYVEVLVGNQEALQFFSSLGFTKVGQTYYTTRMIKPL